MQQKEFRRKIKHYNTPNHAHELTFSCYHHCPYLSDEIICDLFINELANARIQFNFSIWAYVLMPDHVHLLIKPNNEEYSISKILQYIKGKPSTQYRHYLIQNFPDRYDSMCIIKRGRKIFKFWQTGPGFDRNLWNTKVIHHSIQYIEANPVRKGLCGNPEEYKWSSAFARTNKNGLMPDTEDIPMLMK